MHYKEFDGFDFGFGPRVLPMGRGKIKRETKREKRDFRLGKMQEEGESMYKSKERGSFTRKKKKRAAKRELLREKRRQPKESCVCRKK